MAVKNPDIGTVPCPFTGESAPLRRYRTGQRLAYYSSKAGQIKPNLVQGQKYIYDHAVFNDPEDKRQIGDWLAARGVALEPASDPAPAEPTRDNAPGDDSDVIELEVGGDPEPAPAPAEPIPDKKPPTPVRSGDAFDDFF